MTFGHLGQGESPSNAVLAHPLQCSPEPKTEIPCVSDALANQSRLSIPSFEEASFLEVAESFSHDFPEMMPIKLEPRQPLVKSPFILVTDGSSVFHPS